MNHEIQAGECWMKLGEAAFALGVSEITLRRKVKGGRLPHEFRDGKYYVLLQRDPATGSYSEPGTSAGYPALESRRPTLEVPLRNADTSGLAQQAQVSNARIRELQSQLEEKDHALRSLRRTVEDQQTLIGFLEQTIAALAEKKNRRNALSFKRGAGAVSRG